MVRQISGVNSTRRRGIDRIFLEETPEVRFLLIGSNTYPPIPGVDEEINQLQKTLFPNSSIREEFAASSAPRHDIRSGLG